MTAKVSDDMAHLSGPLDMQGVTGFRDEPATCVSMMFESVMYR